MINMGRINYIKLLKNQKIHDETKQMEAKKNLKAKKVHTSITDENDIKEDIEPKLKKKLKSEEKIVEIVNNDESKKSKKSKKVKTEEIEEPITQLKSKKIKEISKNESKKVEKDLSHATETKSKKNGENEAPVILSNEPEKNGLKKDKTHKKEKAASKDKIAQDKVKSSGEPKNKKSKENDGIVSKPKKAKNNNDGENSLKPEKKTKKVNTPNETLSTEVSENAGKSKLANRFKKKKKANKAEEAKSGVIYVSHLPYGFTEEGLRKFFTQYGDIKNLHLARSSKTARSKGYAFIEFVYREVAEIAAKAVDGYLMYDKQLSCKLVEGDGIHVSSKKFKYIPWKRIFIKEKNKEKSEDQLKKVVDNLLKNEENRKEKLKELGIKYDFPGFHALVENHQA